MRGHGARPARWRGFTLIELLVTVAIVGVLATVTVPLAQLTVQRHKEQELRRGLRELRTAIDAYKRAADEGRILRRVDDSGYPPTLQLLVDGVEDARRSDRGRLYFLRRLPRDPFAPATLDPAASWGKRSYASPPEAPTEGRDVYDVHSLAPGAGLNGVPYRQW